MGLFGNHSDSIPAVVPQTNTLGSQGTTVTGLSGNELYCIALSGYAPGNIVVGNSVYAIGALGGFATNIHAALGGEAPQFTNMIAEGRRLALERLEGEVQQGQALGATGVTSEVVFHAENIEFLSVGSSLYAQNGATSAGYMTSAANGQELFCQIDAGFVPVRLALGNVAYSVGLARGILGSIRQLAHGEISEYSNAFTVTRNLALQRICEDAKRFNANSVVGIRTTVVPIGNKGLQEMIMLGTASTHPGLASLAQQAGGIITSDLTSVEMWNTMRLGYAPMQLVLGTSVYSLGVVGEIKAALRDIAKGEVNSLTEMIYGARQQSLKKVQEQAVAVGADMVIGTKTYIYPLGNGLVEFLAIGTAVKRSDNVRPKSDQLPPQAVIGDKSTYVDTTQHTLSSDISHQTSGTNTNIPMPPNSADAAAQAVQA